MNRACFLDRDGVIVKDTGYNANWRSTDVLDGCEDGLRLLVSLGYELIVVTNQSGIGRGYFSLTQYHHFTARMADYFLQRNIRFSDILFCPHSPGKFNEPICSCRKPRPGMIEAAAKKHEINLAESILIGDRSSDIEAGLNANVGELFALTPDPESIIDVSSNCYIASDWRELACMLTGGAAP